MTHAAGRLGNPLARARVVGEVRTVLPALMELVRAMLVPPGTD